MRKLSIGGCFLAAVLCLTTVSRGDDPPELEEPSPSAGSPEPITGTPSVPNPGSESSPNDPFQPYGIGVPLAEAWSYDQLGVDDRAIADRGRTDDFSQVNAGYASAVRERATAAKANHAGLMLGIDNVGGGVVP